MISLLHFMPCKLQSLEGETMSISTAESRYRLSNSLFCYVMAILIAGLLIPAVVTASDASIHPI